MPAGPYPTKVMHEALKTRVDTLEQAAPGGGGGFSPVYGLSQTPTTAHSPYGAKTNVQATGVYLGTSASSRTIAVGGVSLPVELSQSQIGEIRVELDGEQIAYPYVQTVDSGPGYSYVMFLPVMLPPGAQLVVVFTSAVSMPTQPNIYAPGANGTGDNGFRTGYLDGAYSEVPAYLEVSFSGFERSVYGQLPPESMNVVRVPTAQMGIQHFEIVDPVDGAAPTLRYRARNGTIYRVQMTAEV